MRHDRKWGYAPKENHVIIGNGLIECLIDTGAEVNIITEGCLHKMDLTNLESVTPKLRAYGPNNKKTIVPVMGKIWMTVSSEHTRKVNEDYFYILQNKAENLLSCKTSEALGLVNFNVQSVHMPTDPHLENEVDFTSQIQRPLRRYRENGRHASGTPYQHGCHAKTTSKPENTVQLHRP